MSPAAARGAVGVALRAVALTAALTWSAEVHASEYDLESVAFLTAEEVKALKKLPARTTHDAGRALAKPSARKKAAKRLGIEKKRLCELAALFDLLRVRGVGPRMALLLRASGVTACPDLAREDPEDLAKRMQEANARVQVANKLPDAEILKHWIGQAAKLPVQYRK